MVDIEGVLTFLSLIFYVLTLIVMLVVGYPLVTTEVRYPGIEEVEVYEAITEVFCTVTSISLYCKLYTKLVV